MNWVAGGSVCPTCGGQGRNSKRYPAALCRSCEETLVDRQGRQITFSIAGSGPFGGGDILIEVEGADLSENNIRFLERNRMSGPRSAFRRNSGSTSRSMERKNSTRQVSLNHN